MAHRIHLRVNGISHAVDVEDRWTLADLLRDGLGLFGTKLGCEHGSCGSCTVLCDDAAVRSCLELAARLDGSVVVTVEGHGDGHGGLSPLQDAFAARHALQCGYCTAGFLASAEEYVRGGGAPNDEAIRDHLSGNLCRCTGYQGIVDAVLDVLEGGAR